MKWFDKWFYKKARQVWENNPYAEEDSPMPSNMYGRKNAVVSSTRTLESNGVNFRLYTASGGHVVELNHYDSQTDRQTTGLHIIPASEDLGQSLAHIITIEALKR
jgi:hypothetical protein